MQNCRYRQTDVLAFKKSLYVLINTKLMAIIIGNMCRLQITCPISDTVTAGNIKNRTLHLGQHRNRIGRLPM